MNPLSLLITMQFSALIKILKLSCFWTVNFTKEGTKTGSLATAGPDSDINVLGISYQIFAIAFFPEGKDDVLL